MYDEKLTRYVPQDPAPFDAPLQWRAKPTGRVAERQTRRL